ncbi:lipopolysaccharide export system protein LptA [Thermoflavifilum aggregans]|uniref:Lipopolysaccharide export system protein LptA n=1 Tax=Thermoflavifilum aggregans TaxID=454188 RepID=A0A2M9CWJ2_9BACT|nr:OstA-like protein [Thermoflavifilum aggregans]PJJ76245.1 lipopolysaccharide export system protein LptA [Thermoflavifilum aggregans]
MSFAMIRMISIGLIVWIGCICLCLAAYAQQPAARNDSVKIIYIIHADSLIGIQKKDSDITKLMGHVMLQQGNTLFSCDSAYKNNTINVVDAYGHIHINQADSVHAYGDYLHYLGNDKLATLSGHVRLQDAQMTLYTETLTYDLNQHIAQYQQGGKLVSEQTTLTSQSATYYTDLHQAYFQHRVKLKDPQYTLSTDTLVYHTDTHTAYFVAPTVIHLQDSVTVIHTRDGYYNTDLGEAMFASRSVITDSSQMTTADSLFYFREKGTGLAKGNVIWRDTSRKVTVVAGYAETHDQTHTLLATQQPVLIYEMKNDTLYTAADTLFSGIIPRTDSAMLHHADSSHQDSSEIRYFSAFHHVRIYSDSLQAVADSMYYSFADSTFRFYIQPVVWIGDYQLSGDTIYLSTQNQQAKELQLIENAIIVNQIGKGMFNQVKGRTIYGYFHDNRLDWMHVNGNAESVYYVQDDAGAFIGINKVSCGVIDIYFRDQKVYRVAFRDEPSGSMSPIKGANLQEYFLRNFSWQIDRRPHSREELLPSSHPVWNFLQGDKNML